MREALNAYLCGMKGFYGQLAALAGGVAVILLLVQFLLPELWHPRAWWLWGYMLAVTGLGHLAYSKNMEGMAFFNTTMSQTGIRLFLALGVLFGYFFTENLYPIRFAVYFFLLYFLFQGFEIRALLANLHRNS